MGEMKRYRHATLVINIKRNGKVTYRTSKRHGTQDDTGSGDYASASYIEHKNWVSS